MVGTCASLSTGGCLRALLVRSDVRALGVRAGLAALLRAPGAPCERSFWFMLLMCSLVRAYSAPAAELAALAAGLREVAGPVVADAPTRAAAAVPPVLSTRMPLLLYEF